MRVRVLTYNIRSGTDVVGRPRLDAQAGVVAEAAPDLVLLQEVLGRAQAERIARGAGLCHVAFGATRGTPAGDFGNAMLCRWPLHDVDNHLVPPNRLGQPRAALSATILDGEQRVRVVGSHFGLLPGEPERSARLILSLIDTCAEPVIVGGDFNRPLSQAVCHRLLRAGLIDCATVAGRPPQPSYPAPSPVLRLDYVYVRDFVVQDAVVLRSTASDHRPLRVDLELA